MLRDFGIFLNVYCIFVIDAFHRNLYYVLFFSLRVCIKCYIYRTSLDVCTGTGNFIRFYGTTKTLSAYATVSLAYHSHEDTYSNILPELPNQCNHRFLFCISAAFVDDGNPEESKIVGKYK